MPGLVPDLRDEAVRGGFGLDGVDGGSGWAGVVEQVVERLGVAYPEVLAGEVELPPSAMQGQQQSARSPRP